MDMHEPRILGVILAGGTSRRFGSDKCVALLDGMALLERVIERARSQVSALLLNANREINIDSKIERLSDNAPGEGPLAGILAGLRQAEERAFSHVASFACDTPFFPRDTVVCFSKSLHNSAADFAVARCGPTIHRIFALWPIMCRPRLETAYTAGARSMRSIENWLSPARVDFAREDGPGGDAFFNINTRSDLETAERWATRRSRESQLRT
jgi:molybdopterin-guanine dinucleotide biosynthesis protein A